MVFKTHDFSIKIMLLNTLKHDSWASTHCLVSSKWIIMNNYYFWIPSYQWKNKNLYDNLKLQQYRKLIFMKVILQPWGFGATKKKD